MYLTLVQYPLGLNVWLGSGAAVDAPPPLGHNVETVSLHMLDFQAAQFLAPRARVHGHSDHVCQLVHGLVLPVCVT